MTFNVPFVGSSTPALRARSTRERHSTPPPTLADVARVVRSHLALASRPATHSDYIQVRDALSRLCGRHAPYYDPELFWAGVRAFVRASGLTTFVNDSAAAKVLAAHVASGEGVGPVRLVIGGSRPLHSHFNRLTEYADAV
jgi:hypothetical protein